MDYEKAYKEAVKRAKSIIEDLRKGEDILAISEIESMFPELKESEDEKIRKSLIKMFSSFAKKDWYNIPTEKIIAWLEKQGLPIKGNYYMCIKEYATYDEPEFEVGKVYLSEKDGTITTTSGGQLPFKDITEFFRLATHQEIFMRVCLEKQFKKGDFINSK